MKKILIFLVIIGAFAYYISRNLPEILRTFNVASGTAFQYLAIAFVLSALAYLLMVLMNKIVFSVLGINRTLFEMTKLQMSSLVVNILIPTAGASVAVLFANEAKERNESPTAAVTAVLVAFFTDYISISTILIFALAYLYIIHFLTLAVFIPAVFFLLITTLIFFMIYLSGKNPKMLKKIFSYLMTKLNIVLNRFKIATKKPEKETNEFLNDLIEANKAISKNWTRIGKAIIAIFISHLFYVISIYVIFLSMGIHPLYRSVLAGYAIGTLFLVVSPTPSGVGFVEGAMVLTYTSMGIPTNAAATAAILYRGFSFWIPLTIGFFVYQSKNIKNITGELFSKLDSQ